MIFLKAYTRLNLGDDLFIKKICSEYENEKFYILADKKYKQVFKKIKNLKVMSYSYNKLAKRKNNLSKWKKANEKFLKRISKICDTYVYIGGSIFIENSDTSIERVMDLKKEIGYFKKKYIIGANFGPYTTQNYLNYIHDELIPSLNHISFRDKDSYDLFKDLKNVKYAPDILFSFDNNIKEKNSKELGISLIHHLERKELKDNYDNYLNQILKISELYLEKGYNIRLLSFCSYENDPVAIDDYLELIKEEYKDKIKVTYYNGNIDEFLSVFSKLDTIIATRFHSIVLGFIYCHKVIPICYSNKAVNLLNDLDIKEYVTFKNLEKLSQVHEIKFNKKQLKKLHVNSMGHFKILNFDTKKL